jgi:AraC-like DNA-binding protein
VTEADRVMSDHDILATNVLPAFEASLCFGASEEELANQLGWRRDALEVPDATVDGPSTYRHMELMHAKPRYEAFVLAAAQRHTLSSLGVVGLACKSAPTVGEALALHHRYQTITNRTATYGALVEDDRLVFREERPSQAFGSLLISEYTMLVTLHLLRTAAAQPPRVLEMSTRRPSLEASERVAYEHFLTAPILCGAPSAQLVFDASFLNTPMRSADPEMERYFQEILRQSLVIRPSEPGVVRDVRVAIQARLIHGTPTNSSVARELGIGHRTLQRRLSTHGVTFARLLDTTRKALVDGFLRRPELSLTEITYLLGYSEQASFYRAFRRWYQSTPANYRLRYTRT